MENVTSMSDLVIELHNQALDNPTLALILRAKDYTFVEGPDNTAFISGWAVFSIMDRFADVLSETDLRHVVENAMITLPFPGANHAVVDLLIAEDLQGNPEVHVDWLADVLLEMDAAHAYQLAETAAA